MADNSMHVKHHVDFQLLEDSGACRGEESRPVAMQLSKMQAEHVRLASCWWLAAI